MTPYVVYSLLYRLQCKTCNMVIRSDVLLSKQTVFMGGPFVISKVDDMEKMRIYTYDVLTIIARESQPISYTLPGLSVLCKHSVADGVELDRRRC